MRDGSALRELAKTAAPVGRALRDMASALRLELVELQLFSGRGPHSIRTALAVALATTAALEVHVGAVWWSAISAFVSIQTTAPASIRRGVLRVAGTAIGAAVGLLLSPWLVEDDVALGVALAVLSTLGVLGLLISQYGYAWVLGGITADMVLLATLSDPLSALDTALNRTSEVTIGTVAAVLVALVLAADAEAATPAPAAGWSDLLGAQWPAVQHALRAGIGVMLVPLVWNWLDLPSLSQTAVTVAAVMAVPSVTNDAAMNRQRIIERAIHRISGCLVGGVAGLACLALSVQTFLPWLLMLSIGMWVAAHVQASQRGIGYVGMQGAIVFISTLVQGWGPPTSLQQGFERFAGITGGLLILLMVSLLTAPSVLPRAAPDDVARK